MDGEDRHEADHHRPEAERRNDGKITRGFAHDRFGLNAHGFPQVPFVVGAEIHTPLVLRPAPIQAFKLKRRFHPALTRRSSARLCDRRAISRSSLVASSALTSTIGERTSAEAISPVCASQYLAGAGLGSANKSRVSSATSCQHADAPSRSPAFSCVRTRAKMSVAT